MRYEDFTIELSGARSERRDRRQMGMLRVRVLASPEGEMTPEQACELEYDEGVMQRTLRDLEARTLDRAGLVALGRTLASLLLPTTAQRGGPSVRELFARSDARVGRDAGLRLRLRLPRELSPLPWEYAYVERSQGDAMDGFVALHPRIAIVRHEVLAVPVELPRVEGDLRVVAAFAGPPDAPPLDLERERKILEDALRDVEGRGVTVEAVPDATLAKLQPHLAGASVFHFAGHGDYARAAGARFGTYTGTGSLVLDDARVPADQLAVNLRGRVRLAVLGGCETGRRDGVSVWSGIAPALVQAEIPAVIANQLSIKDRCAIAFTHRLYEALAGGLPLERAVTDARIAVFNVDADGRDWGVPVLYLRAGDGQLFSGAADPVARERAREGAEAEVTVRTGRVAAGGIVYGARVERMIAGKLAVDVRVAGDVRGEVTGLDAEELGGGDVRARVETGAVEEGGVVHGARIGRLGWTRARPPEAAAPAREPPPPDARRTRSAPRAAPRAEKPRKKAKASARVAGDVRTGDVRGGTVIGVQDNQRTVHIESATFMLGPQGGAAPAPASAPRPELVEEKLRLDVALPRTAVVDEPFDVVIAVKQPTSPVLAVPDLDQVVSADGQVFREDDRDVVRYRIKVSGDGFDVDPESYVVVLRSGTDSRPVCFQLVGRKEGKRSLRVDAYQEDGALAAQTRIFVEVGVAVNR